MKGDFSRITYNESKNYALVLMQQGRVQLDADWNEQALLQLFRLQMLAADLIGPYGGSGDSFKIEKISGNPPDFQIGGGHYYVDGILCENNSGDRGNVPVTYRTQPYNPSLVTLDATKRYLVYLHVWLRHITAVEDGYIREVALKGPDTAARIQIVWQVKVTDKVLNSDGMDDDIPPDITKDKVYNKWPEWVKKWRPDQRGKLKAKGKEDPGEEPSLCTISPQARYRGAENQLYRVEIHRSGEASKDNSTTTAAATFKWSRDNGSVVFPIVEFDGAKTVTLAHLGRDSSFSLKPGDWVEIVDDVSELSGEVTPKPLLKVASIDRETMSVVLSDKPSIDKPELIKRHTLLRRWDHQAELSEGILVVESDKDWITLEDGVQIQFTPSNAAGAKNTYRSGDWWWIPARTETGDVEWPEDGPDKPKSVEAYDAGHHFAPLAILKPGSDPTDLRRVIEPLAK